MTTAERDELAEALSHRCHVAKRQFPKVGTLERPTPWDLDHEWINEHLTLWQLAQPTTRGGRETGHRSGR